MNSAPTPDQAPPLSPDRRAAVERAAERGHVYSPGLNNRARCAEVNREIRAMREPVKPADQHRVEAARDTRARKAARRAWEVHRG